MTTTAVLLLLLVYVVALVPTLCLGVYFGVRIEREQTRTRGEALLEVLAGIAPTWSPAGAPDLRKRLPYIATRRAVASLSHLPDPHPEDIR